MCVLFVDAEMSGKLFDSFREDCYLEFCGACVIGVDLILFSNLRPGITV